MAVYAIYSYELQEGSRSLFYRETGKKAIEMANEIVSNLLHDGLTVVGKKRKEDQPLKSLKLTERKNVFTWVLCNVKDIYQGRRDQDAIIYHNRGLLTSTVPASLQPDKDRQRARVYIPVFFGIYTL